MRRHHSEVPLRQPSKIQAWLIGGGIASLAAAVHLIRDAKVPGSKIHVLDVHHGSGGGMETAGNPTTGYMVYTGRQPYFHKGCMGELLSLVPHPVDSDKTLLETIREEMTGRHPQGGHSTRFIAPTTHGPEKVSTKSIPMALHHRLGLMKIMLESEKALGKGRIRDFLNEEFFETGFWFLWSTTFALQPWHSVVEFRRLLRKYLQEMQSMNDVQPADRINYTLYQSVIGPITSFLKKEGVDFRFQVKVTDLVTYPNGDPTGVSKIKILNHQGVEILVTVDPKDIVILTLGSMMSGFSQGLNSEPPASISILPEDWQIGDWSLWFQLASRSSKFGAPSNFCPRTAESSLETFTVTLRSSDFFDLLIKLTEDRPGSGKHISILGSNWGLSISIPHQPVFADQPNDVQVFWGYSLLPEREGNYIKKPMFSCAGEEIMEELLSHLQFPIESILPASITIPCIFPQATSIMLPRAEGDRPAVIPPETTNLAFIGQFVEIPDDTVFSMEYSVRSAQMAVYGLMGIAKAPKKIKRNRFAIFELLI